MTESRANPSSREASVPEETVRKERIIEGCIAVALRQGTNVSPIIPRDCEVISAVIASHPVGAKRRRMTGSAKESIYPHVEMWIASRSLSSRGASRRPGGSQ